MVNESSGDQPLSIGNVSGADVLPLFGKKFKVRVRSLKTNKAIDINISFEKLVNVIKKVEELPDEPRLIEMETSDLVHEGQFGVYDNQ